MEQKPARRSPLFERQSKTVSDRIQPNAPRFAGTENYIATPDLNVAVNAAIALQRPLLIKGEPGTGKTVLAHEIAAALGAPLIEWHIKSTTKAQHGLYEYDAVKRLRDGQLGDPRVQDISNYIVRGKVWEAFTADKRPVLLIDEIDKSDEAFEAFLLEILSAYQVSVPELGVIKADIPPIVFLTSNNVRDLGDALKRRCLHLHIPLPDAKLEERIVASRVPGVEARLNRELVGFVQTLRTLDLRKSPSISETVDWARALLLLHAHALEPEMVRETLNVLLKFEQDIQAVEPQIAELIRKPVQAAAKG